MPRDISGNYTLPLPPVVDNTIIETSWANPTMNDIANSLSASVSNTGVTPILANMPMNGFKHTGAGPAIASGQYTTFGQSGLQFGDVTLTGLLRLSSALEAGEPLLDTFNTTASVQQFFVAHAGADINLGNVREGSLSLATNNISRLTIANNGSVTALGDFVCNGVIYGPISGPGTFLSGFAASLSIGGNAATATNATTATNANNANTANSATNATNATNLAGGSATFANGGTALDWYQEGTFTPTVSLSTGSPTYVEQSGGFVRIGKLLTFNIRVKWTGAITGASIDVGGLPFTTAGRLQPVTVVANLSDLGVYWTPGKIPNAYTNGGTTINLISTEEGATAYVIQQGTMGGVCDLMLQGSVLLA